MAQFSYLAKDGQNKKRKGKIDASSQRDAYGKLRAQQLRVISLEEVPETLWTKNFELGGKLKQRDFVIYLRQFSTLIKAGITIVNATHILAQQTESKVLQKTLFEMELSLREGVPLSETYENYSKLFKPFFTNMINAGETAGTIDETLERLANYYDKQYRTKQKVVSALTYPIILSILSLIVVTFLLVFIVPIFEDLFLSLDAQLPAITRFVLSASQFFQDYYLFIIILIGMVVGAMVILKRSEKGSYFIDHALLRMPIFGTLLQKSAIARTASTLSSLFASSVPILQSVAITEKIVGNQVLSNVLHQGRECLERGDSLTTPMKEHWAIPPLVVQMIMIGEQTGALDKMLSEVASFYESEVEAVTDRLKSLIEPIMILVLAIIVGIIVLAIMVPMFELFNNIG